MLNQDFQPTATTDGPGPTAQADDLHSRIRAAINEVSPDGDVDEITDAVMAVLVPYLTSPQPMVAGNNPGNFAITAFNRGAPNERLVDDRGVGISPASDMHGVGGFARHPDLGHVIGVENAPIPANETTEYPKWIEPHESWVQLGGNGTPMAPMFVNQHVDWSNREHPRLMVMVDSREAEDRALAQNQQAQSDGAAERQAPNAGIGGGDPTGTKTLYPAGNEDAENADPAGFAERSADLNEERDESEDGKAVKAEEDRLRKVTQEGPRKTK